MQEHGPTCNCEDCHWAHHGEMVCPCCGLPLSQLTPDSTETSEETPSNTETST